MYLLEKGAQACAVLAGILLTVITLITCISLIGRNTVGWTIVGDVELTGFVAGAAVALFLPWCQLRRGNIIVDFFTAKAAPATQAALDRLGALALCAVMVLMTWRSAVGGLNAWHTKSGSMMLGLPEWTVYLALVPAMALTAVIALTQALRGFAAFGNAGAAA